MNLNDLNKGHSDPMAFTYVPNYKPKSAKIALVGEAAGRDEVRVGKPMSGDTGYNIRKFSAAGGIDFESCARLNVFPYHPPDNEISSFIDMGKQPRVKAGYENAVEFLYQELSAIPDLQVIVPMGNVALWALTGLQQITKWRGSPLWSERLQKRVIPTIHPSPKVVNKDWLVRYLIMADFEKAGRFLDNPELTPPKRDLRIKPTFNEAISFIDYCEFELPKDDMVGFDIETSRRAVDCFSLSASPTLAMSIPLCKGNSDYYMPAEEAQILHRLSRLLCNEQRAKALQNAIFDFGEVYKLYGMVIRNLHDTLIMHRVLYPELPKDLATLVSLYSDEIFYKDDLKIHRNITDYDLYWRYNAKDSALTLEIAYKLMNELSQKGMMAQYVRQKFLVEPFIVPRCVGLRVNKPLMDTMSEQLSIKILETTVELQELTNKPINPFSPIDTKNMFTSLGEKLLTNRKTQKPTLDKYALFQFATKEKTARHANLLLDIRSMKKRLDYYRTGTVNSRIHTDMNPAGTETGRPASGKDDYGEGGNILNLTSEFKKCIIPDIGCFFFECDYSQAEARIVSVIAPEPTMRATFEAKIDIHRKTSSLIFNKSVEEVTPKERQVGKTANHSLNYKLGAISFARRNRLPLTFASYVRSRYYQVYPGLIQFHEWIDYEVNKKGTLTNCLGSKRWFLDRPGDDRAREGCAYIPQSTVADCIHQFGLPILYNDFVEAMFLNDVYDSLWAQVPFDLDKRIIAKRFLQLKQSMEQTLYWKGEEFYIPVDFKIGWNAGEKFDLKVTEDIDKTAADMTEILEAARAKIVEPN